MVESRVKKNKDLKNFSERCAARRRRVAEAVKRAPPDAPCACVAGACDAAGLARAFARLGGDESLCRICG